MDGDKSNTLFKCFASNCYFIQLSGPLHLGVTLGSFGCTLGSCDFFEENVFNIYLCKKREFHGTI